MWRLRPDAVAAAAWAALAVRSVRRQLRHRDPLSVAVPKAPRARSDAAERAVRGTLLRLGATCLVEGLVRQAWHHEQGQRRDLVIGVRGGASHFEAHAWLDGDPEADIPTYRELLRRPGATR